MLKWEESSVEAQRSAGSRLDPSSSAGESVVGHRAATIHSTGKPETASNENMSFMVKNTFIDPPLSSSVLVDARHRRSSSVPSRVPPPSHSSTSVLWIQAQNRLPPPEPIPPETIESGSRKPKRTERGKRERSQFNDVTHRPLDMIPFRKCTNKLQPRLLEDEVVKRYLAVISFLEEEGVPVVAIEMRKRSSSDQSDAVGICFVADLTLMKVSPRMMLVDFVVLPKHCAEDIYAEIGRWMFNQLLSDKTADIEGNPFQRHGDSCKFCLIAPLTTDGDEQRSETRVMESVGFQPVSEQDLKRHIMSILDDERWTKKPLLDYDYFEHIKYRRFLSFGPFSAEEGQVLANKLFSKEVFEDVKHKIHASSVQSGKHVQENCCMAKRSLSDSRSVAVVAFSIGVPM